MNDKVTVVVPVYNVEKYLDRCVESLLHQTVQGYRIILVDDGSMDCSGKKCDDWALKSNIITTFHKQNGGLSDARNYGVQYVDTEYVTFVDSDDYVEPEYIELLLKGFETGADMVVTHHIQEYEDQPQKAVIDEKFNLYSAEEALKKMCYEEISTSAGGKLFPKSYILDNPYPVGKLYEDLWTTYKYIGRSKKIAFNKSQTYHYLQRKGSIRQGRWKEQYFDVMDGTKNLLKYIDENYPSIHSAGVFRYFYSANELYVRAFNEEDYINITKPVQKKLKQYMKELLSNSDVSNKFKIQYFLMTNLPKTYRKIWVYIKRRK